MIDRRAALLLLTASAVFPASAWAQDTPPPIEPLAWSAYVRRTLARNVRYPAHLRGQDGEGPSGKVIVRIRVDRQGRMLKAEVAQSSGVPEFDQAALDAARRSDPLDAPPMILAAAEPEVLVPFEFRAR